MSCVSYHPEAMIPKAGSAIRSIARSSGEARSRTRAICASPWASANQSSAARIAVPFTRPRAAATRIDPDERCVAGIDEPRGPIEASAPGGYDGSGGRGGGIDGGREGGAGRGGDERGGEGTRR